MSDAVIQNNKMFLPSTSMEIRTTLRNAVKIGVVVLAFFYVCGV